jgi:hypothetical protein
MDHVLAAGWVLAFGMLFAMILWNRPLAVPVLVGRIGAAPRPRDPDEEEQLPGRTARRARFPGFPRALR